MDFEQHGNLIMKKSILRVAGVRGWPTLFLLLGLGLLFSNALAKGENLEALFPAEKQIAPWQKDGAFQYYAGKNLRNYLDGGADIYLEYGFRSVGVQAYKKEQQNLQIEVYHMESPEAALGIFSFRRHYKADSSVAFPNESSKYDFLFAKGSYFVAVTNMDGSSRTAGVLKKFALFVLEKIPAEALDSNPFDKLPPRGLVPNSPMLIDGPLAMRVRWPLGQIHCFHFDRGTRAVTGRYRSGKLNFSLYVIFPGKRVDFYSLVECFGNILNGAMVVKSNSKIVLAMMNSRKTIFLKKGKTVWIIPDLFDDLPVLKFLGEM